MIGERTMQKLMDFGGLESFAGLKFNLLRLPGRLVFAF